MDFALIGMGYWGKNYYRILNTNDNINNRHAFKKCGSGACAKIL